MQTEYTRARQNMVAGQLRPNQVSDANLLARFSTIPRELFVAPNCKNYAYADQNVPMGHGRQLVPPLVIGRLVQALALQPTDECLVVAGGTGYTAALIRPLVQQVVLTETDTLLRAQAQNNLLDTQCEKVLMLTNPLADGAPSHAPYHKIILDVPVPTPPPALFAQLRSGGQLGAMTQGADGLMDVVIYTKTGKQITSHTVLDAPVHVPSCVPQPVEFQF